MKLFLDESGDCILKSDNKNHSLFFIISILVCHDDKSHQALKSAVKYTLKRKLNAKSHQKRM